MLSDYILALVLGSALAVIVGANNGAISLGANMGAHIITHRGAVLLSIVGMVSGFFLEGNKMQNAIFGVVIPKSNSMVSSLSSIVLTTAIVVMIVSTYAEIPLSLSQTAVGAVVGSALAIGIDIYTTTVAVYLISWTLTPFSSALLAGVVARLLRRISKRGDSVLRMSQLYARLTIATSTYTSYVLGANVLGVLAATMTVSLISKTVVVLCGAVIGTVFLHRRVARTTGDRLATLTPTSALATQVSAAVALHVLTELTVPSSLTQALVGAMLGTRFTKGVAISNRRMMRETLFWWAVAPVVGLVFAYGLAMGTKLVLVAI